MLPFAKLQVAMTRLRFKDESVLRDLGLAKLTKTFDAYPLVEDGAKLFVLLPRGMDPGEARQLSSAGAASKIVVLAQAIGTGTVAKVWPPDEAAREAAGAEPSSSRTQAPDLDFEIVEE